MKIGSFNINDYLNKLNEEASVKEDAIIPEENMKSYSWLKSEFQKGKNEVKVEMTSTKFEPGYTFSGSKDFKPEVTGGENTAKNVPDISIVNLKTGKETSVKTGETKKAEEPKKQEAEPEKKETQPKKAPIKLEPKKVEKKAEPEKKEEKEEPNKEEKEVKEEKEETEKKEEDKKN